MELKTLTQRIRRARQLLKVLRDRRALFANPDLCLWIQRPFRLGWRRFVKRGEDRGFTVVRMGWITGTVRW